MKRQISISIFLAIIVILLAFLYIKFFNANKAEEKGANEQLIDIVTEHPAITISQEYMTYPFYIKEENGRLVVYRTQTQEYYMETGIEIHDLPQEIQEKLEFGIFFQTENELYNFLESYSS